MDYQSVIKKGLSLGLSEIQIMDSTTISNNMSLINGSLESYNIKDTKSITIKGKLNDQMGIATTEVFTDEAIDECLMRVLKNAKYLAAPEPDFIYNGEGEYVEVVNEVSDFDKISVEEKVNFLKKVEKRLLEEVPQVLNVQVVLGESRTKIKLVNSYGLDLNKDYSNIHFYGMVVAGDATQTISKYDGDIQIYFKDLNIDKVCDKIVNEVKGSLGAGFVETGKYPIILSKEPATEILSAFSSSIFSGVQAMHKLSILTDKVNTKIFGDNITLTNDPFNKKALFRESFDLEGVPCKKIDVVKNGVFTGFLHNLSSANFFKTSPTGNGFNGNVGLINFYLNPGEYSEEDMIKTIDKGILITEVTGLHAGLNPISGNFNVQSSGYLIENGVKTKGVTLFVLSSNFYELMNNVEMIGNNIDDNFTDVACPSIKIKDVQISGK